MVIRFHLNCQQRSDLFGSTACSMWFQRITEVEAEAVMVEANATAGTSDRGEQSSSLPRSSAGPVLSPADFQRVRMLRKITLGHLGLGKGHTHNTKNRTPCEILGCNIHFARPVDMRRHVKEVHSAQNLCPEPNCNVRIVGFL
jgi:hypothetical protein